MPDTHVLPDGSAFFVGSHPLPQTHWLYANHENIPPMPFRTGTSDDRRKAFNASVREAAKYAIRAATMNGKVEDFDPDAMVQNFVVGMLGYHTSNGLSGEAFGDPEPIPPQLSPTF